MTHFVGMMVAPVTPIDAGGEVNLKLVPLLAETLIRRGAQGFYLCGGTGEGMLLTVTERMQLTQRWKQVVGDAYPLYIHVGHTCIQDARALAAHAAKIGAHAISSVTPPVYPAKDAKMLVKTFAAIASAAPGLPFYYYHSSGSPGLKIRGIDYLIAADNLIPNMAGMKFTHEDLMDLSRCLRHADGRFDILYGKDEMILGALATGARGFVGGSYNVLSPLVRKIMGDFDHGELELAAQDAGKLVDAVAAFQRYGGLPAVKAAMRFLGVDCGPVRLPLRALEDDEAERLWTDLQRVWSMAASPATSYERTAVSTGVAV